MAIKKGGFFNLLRGGIKIMINHNYQHKKILMNDLPHPLFKGWAAWEKIFD